MHSTPRIRRASCIIEWAGKAADQRFPVFIPRVIRPYDALFRRSAAWPAVLKKMNLA